MDRLQRVFRHLLAGLMLVALGAAAGNVMFSPEAVRASSCDLKQCFVWADNTWTCEPTTNAWNCVPFGDTCQTEECDDGGDGCEPTGECIE